MSSSLEPLTQLDRQVRFVVYDEFISRGQCLGRSEVAARLSVSAQDVAASYRRLADAHMLVLQPASGEVLMANPFSAVPTPFQVRSGEKSWWGNCIWDALGVLAMTGRGGRVVTSCPDCGDALSLEVGDRSLSAETGLVHFAVPAARWWEDIVFT